MNINVTIPTKHQMAVAASHGVAIAGGALSALFFAGVLTQAQVSDASGDVNRIVADLKDLYGAISGLAAIAMLAYSTVKSGPLASFFRAAQDIAADPKMIARAQVATLDQKAPVVAITDKLPEVAGVPTVDTRGGKALATAVQSATVQVAKASVVLMAFVLTALLFAPAAQAAGRKAIASPIINAFNALAALVEKDGAGAVTLSTQIPELHDYVGQACFTQIALIGEVVKAHKLPLTLQVATDFEAARLVGMALNKICANPNCGQVWTDVQNVVTAINPGVIPVSLPSICAKIPVMGTVAVSQVPAAAPAATPSGAVIAPANSK